MRAGKAKPILTETKQGSNKYWAENEDLNTSYTGEEMKYSWRNWQRNPGEGNGVIILAGSWLAGGNSGSREGTTNKGDSEEVCKWRKEGKDAQEENTANTII